MSKLVGKYDPESQILLASQLGPLVALLMSDVDDLQKANAATEIWKLAEENDSGSLENRQIVLSTVGAVDALLSFAASCEVENYRYRAFGALSNLCFRNPVFSTRAGSNELLVVACTKAFEGSDDELKIEALRAVNNILYYSSECQQSIVSLVSLLMTFLDDESQSKEVRCMCMSILESLSVSDHSRNILLPAVHHSLFKPQTTSPTHGLMPADPPPDQRTITDQIPALHPEAYTHAHAHTLVHTLPPHHTHSLTHTPADLQLLSRATSNPPTN